MMMRSSPQLDQRPSMKLNNKITDLLIPRRIGAALTVTRDGPFSTLPLRQLNRTVNILNYKYRPIPSPQQQSPQIRIPLNIRQLQIINIKPEIVRHRSYQARFPSPRRPVKQVTPLPDPAHFPVEILPPHEPVEVLDDGFFQSGLDCQRVEGRRVLEVDRDPGRVELEKPLLRRIFVVVVDGGLGGVVVVAVVGVDEAPVEVDVVELVGDEFGLGESEGEGWVIWAFGDFEAVDVGAELFGAEVGLGGGEELVEGDAVALLDDEGGAAVAGAEEVAAEGVGEVGAELAGEELVEHCLDEDDEGGDGGVRGEDGGWVGDGGEGDRHFCL
ncbi:DEAD/DEAH box helicase [Striga asiatica]|uniref:DEAD/DEAH box helicase n=1 Tax=Striga asiatica TaxID=4170 RepID=A0A5A7P603_STRAF|nr:DEAD/DEAH box helicase [Striga asiatica]